MHGQLKPQQIALIVGSGPVRDEFSRKVKELNRRLKMNGMDYTQWDTLNDRQHDIFTDNLFLDGECATSPEHYVHGAVEGCGCPDTEEDLHHHSPALMGEIEKQRESLPDLTVTISEGLQSLNTIVDDLLLEYIAGSGADVSARQYKSTLNIFDLLSPAEYEKAKNKGCEYEADVIQSMNEFTIDTSEEQGLGFKAGETTAGACDDATGADADFYVDGQLYNLEVKLDAKAPMGSTSVAIWPKRTLGGGEGKMFEFVSPDEFDGVDIQNKVYAVLQERKDLILSFIDDLGTPEWSESLAWKGGEVPATPFKSTLVGYKRAMANKSIPVLDKEGNPLLVRKTGEPKLNSQMNMTGKKGVSFSDTSFILQHYKSKEVDYIQIGGKGLYYLSSNPANLPIPQLGNTGLVIEMRPGKSGSKKRIDPETGEKVRVRTPSDTGEGDFIKASAPFRTSARLDGAGLAQSPYTLDDPESIAAMMEERERNLNKQQPQEDPAEPEGLEVEPQESEGL
tara:strand:+ start:5205 stop:6728 length:1524 start_codon:yes stop_codon:yes gene_type:complete